MSNDDKYSFGAFAVVGCIWLAFLIGVASVIIHFIRKFW